MPSVLLGSRQSLCVRWLWREWLSHRAKCLAGNGIMSSFCPTQEGLFCTFWTRTLMLSPNCLLPRNVTLDRPRGWNAFSRTNDTRKRRISSFLYCFVFCWDSLSFSLLYPLFSFLPLSPPLHLCPDSPESHCVCLGWSLTPDPLAGASQALGLQVPAVTASSSSSLSVHGALFPINAFESIQILPHTLNSTAFTDLGIK